MRKGAFSTVSPIKRLLNLKSPVAPPGFIGPLNGPLSTLDDELDIKKLTTGLPGTIDTMTGEGDQIFAGTGQHTNLYHAGRPYNESNAAYPLDKLETEFVKQQKVGFIGGDIPDLKMNELFSAKAFPGAGGLSSGGDMTYVANPFVRFATKRGFVDVQDTPADVDVAFGVDDEADGVVTKTIGDNKNYLPFMFQDLRDENDQFLYLRAFLKSMAETFTPEWNEDRFYGRTEPVPVYKGTMRTINLAFDMVAWGPKDLPIMYKKLQKLQSMVYPLYDEQGFLKAGPIIKMRVGDLIASDTDKGLSGYITSLDLNYDKSIWNIKQNFKVPRNIEVSLGFTALHETNPGIYKDPKSKKLVFGTATMKKDGSGIDVVSQDTIRKIFKQVRETK
jgi:hypothetical protein